MVLTLFLPLKLDAATSTSTTTTTTTRMTRIEFDEKQTNGSDEAKAETTREDPDCTVRKLGDTVWDDFGL